MGERKNDEGFVLEVEAAIYNINISPVIPSIQLAVRFKIHDLQLTS